MDQDKLLQEINKTVNDSITIIKDYCDSAKQSAESSKTSATNSLNYSKLAGMSTDDAREIAKSVAGLVEIGVDNTLNIEGAAADAKVVGDKFNEVNNSIATTTNQIETTETSLTNKINDINNGIGKISWSSYDVPKWDNKLTNILAIDKDSRLSEVHKTLFFGSETPDITFTNCPYTDGPFYFYRVVRWSGASDLQAQFITVELHEQYPVPGRIWVATYVKSSDKWSNWSVINSPTYSEPGITFHDWIADTNYSSIDVSGDICIVNLQFSNTTPIENFADLGFASLNVYANKTAHGVLVSQTTGVAIDMMIKENENVIYLNARGCNFNINDYFRGQLVFKMKQINFN